MSFKSGRQQENNKLREELKKLRGALKDIKDDILIEAPLYVKYEDSPVNVINTENNFDKLESLKSDELEMLCKFDRFEGESSPELIEDSLKFSIESENKFKGSSYIDENSQKKFENSSPPKRLFENFLQSSPDSKNKFNELNSSPEKNQKITAAVTENLMDSSKIKTDASISSEQKINQKKLLKEIENLRKENTKLRLELMSSKSENKNLKQKTASVPFDVDTLNENRIRKSHTSKSPQPKTANKGISENTRPSKKIIKSVSRSKSKSLTPRDLSEKSNKSPITPRRYKHCNLCDHLLSKGYSTKYCSKHGNIISK